MKKLFVFLPLVLVLIFPSSALTQSMMGPTSDYHTAREEAEGKKIWEKLQVKQLKCKNLTDENYEVLGEYFMGQSIGNTQRHAIMNQMMTSMMGEGGEKQMHVTMGKRLSGCEPNAQILSSGAGFMPMMWMMGWGGGFGIFGWITTLTFWLLLILGVIALIRYLGGFGK